MRRHKLWILLFLFSGLFFHVFSQEIEGKIDEIAKSYIQPYSGMAIMVLKDGVLVYQKGHGYANLENKTPVTADTRFNLGGLSRQITAMAILHLADNKRLDLDEKISDIIGFPDYGKEITVYHLLTHTSGLPSYMGLIEQGRNTPVTNQEVVNLLTEYGKTDFEPGTRYRVSNSDYALLALVIEKKSGMRFDRYLQRRIFRQIGIRDHVVTQSRMKRIKNRASGYIFRGDSGFISNDPGLNTTIAGEAGIYLSLNEYRKFLSALKDDSVLSEESRKLLFQPAKYSSGQEIYPQIVMGWSVGQDKGVRYFYQSGPNNAFTNYVIMIPGTELTIVLLSNQAGLFQLLDRIVYPIANLFTDNLFKERIR